MRNYFQCLVTVLLSSSSLVLGVRTLTTALLLPSTSAKPTTIFNRVYVDPNFVVLKDALADKQIDRYSRRMHSDALESSILCRQQPLKGNCKKNIERYYYNYYTRKCSTFMYSGCNGNKNNFESLYICDQHCEGPWGVLTLMNGTKPEDFCSFQPHSGLCLAWMPRYYYDINERKCKTFIYGGCGGNQNRFNTESLCMETCGHEAEEGIDYSLFRTRAK